MTLTVLKGVRHEVIQKVNLAFSDLTTRKLSMTIEKALLVEWQCQSPNCNRLARTESDEMEPELYLTGNQGAKTINNCKAQKIQEGLALCLFIHI